MLQLFFHLDTFSAWIGKNILFHFKLEIFETFSFSFFFSFFSRYVDYFKFYLSFESFRVCKFIKMILSHGPKESSLQH